MRKKDLLRAALTGTGILSVRWRLLPHGLYCFNFHRIGDPASTEYSRNIFSCTRDRFEECTIFLKENFELVDLERIQHLQAQRNRSRKPFALITFDDGYVDNYTHAFPVLQRYEAPAVFFLPTGFIGKRTLPWWEEISWLLRRSAGKSIRLSGAERPFDLKADDGERSIRSVMTFVKARSLPAQEQVAEVRAACGYITTQVEAPAERLFLNWDEARQMHSAGLDIGSHTHSHVLLGHLSRAEQTKELGESKEILEGEIGSPIRSVAYPVGSRTAYTPETCSIAASLGYRLGFNFLRRTNSLPLSNPLDIGRLAVSGNATLASLRSAICFPQLFAE